MVNLLLILSIISPTNPGWGVGNTGVCVPENYINPAGISFISPSASISAGYLYGLIGECAIRGNMHSVFCEVKGVQGGPMWEVSSRIGASYRQGEIGIGIEYCILQRTISPYPAYTTHSWGIGLLYIENSKTLSVGGNIHSEFGGASPTGIIGIRLSRGFVEFIWEAIFNATTSTSHNTALIIHPHPQLTLGWGYTNYNQSISFQIAWRTKTLSYTYNTQFHPYLGISWGFILTYTRRNDDTS